MTTRLSAWPPGQVHFSSRACGMGNAGGAKLCPGIADINDDTLMRTMTPSGAGPRALGRYLLATWLLGTAGAGLELWLMGHVEGFWQLLPVLLMAAALAAAPVVLLVRGRLVVRGFQVLMALMLVSGPVGMVQHYRAKAEFKREVDPTLEGWALFRQCMTGHTLPPVLAAGAMTLLGLLGLAWTSTIPVSMSTCLPTSTPHRSPA